MAPINPLEGVTEKLMLMGWVGRTHVKDGEGDSSRVGINFTALGLAELLGNPMPVIVQKIQQSQGPLSGPELMVLSGFPMLAKQQLGKMKDPPPNPRFQT